MPIPEPNTGEEHDEFIDRCVAFLVDEGRPQDQAVAICEQQWSKDLNPMPKTDAQRLMFWKTFDRQRWQFLDQKRTLFSTALQKQIKPVLDALENGISAAREQVDLLDHKVIIQPLRSTYLDVGTYYANKIANGLKGDATLIAFKAEGDYEQYVRDFIENIERERSVQITETTKDRIKTLLIGAIDEGLNPRDAAEKLRNSNIIAGRARAEMIARTEIISASNAGSIHGARSTNLNLNKSWIATMDNRTRDHHMTVHRQTRHISKPFDVMNEELDYPADPQGSAANVIQCRCTQAYERIR